EGTSRAATRFNPFELRPADQARTAPAGAIDGPPDAAGIRRTRTGWRKVRPGGSATEPGDRPAASEHPRTGGPAGPDEG
ncbi:MAG TPA: hypothetical protein VET90_01860, partial [Candidatus Binatus sp.]|nr:hypothetical protein [Candidatus Binatus sp.]